MKRLLITCCAVAICFVFVSRSVIAGEQPNGKANEQQHNANKPVAESPTTTPIGGQQQQPASSTQNSDRHCNSTKQYLRILLSPQNVSSVVLAIVGIAGIIVAICTLKAIQGQLAAIKAARKQTDKMIGHAATQAQAAKDAATAANANATALKNSDRAWLLIEIVKATPESQPATEQNPPPAVHIGLRNYGKTPAFIFAAEFRYEISDSPHEPPRPDIYAAYTPIPYERIIAPNQPWIEQPKPEGCLREEQAIAVNNTTGFLWAYGIVKYCDVYEGRHDTKFCYRYQPPLATPEGQAGFCMAGPRAYNNAD